MLRGRFRHSVFSRISHDNIRKNCTVKLGKLSYAHDFCMQISQYETCFLFHPKIPQDFEDMGDSFFMVLVGMALQKAYCLIVCFAIFCDLTDIPHKVACCKTNQKISNQCNFGLE